MSPPYVADPAALRELLFTVGTQIRRADWHPTVVVTVTAAGRSGVLAVNSDGSEDYYRIAEPLNWFVAPPPAPRRDYVVHTEERHPVVGDLVILDGYGANPAEIVRILVPALLSAPYNVITRVGPHVEVWP